MKKIIALLGERENGKSSMARQLTSNCRTVWLDPNQLNDSFAFSDVAPETEYIVIDNVKNIKQVIGLIRADQLHINRLYQKHFTIEKPCVIICSDSLTEEDFPVSRTRFIKVTNPHHGNSN